MSTHPPFAYPSLINQHPCNSTQASNVTVKAGASHGQDLAGGSITIQGGTGSKRHSYGGERVLLLCFFFVYANMTLMNLLC